jgi:predicted dinucleotide-binding enzyme
MITVTLLGAGNVATHFYNAFVKSQNVSVNQWYNRNLEKISSYENKVAICDDISKLTESDIYILAVSDDAVADLSTQLPFTDRLVVHTSGSVNVHD